MRGSWANQVQVVDLCHAEGLKSGTSLDLSFLIKLYCVLSIVLELTVTEKNEAKWAILRVLASGSWLSASEVAAELGLPSASHASQLLHNYHSQRLVKSRRAKGRWRMYAISSKGLDRLRRLS